MSAYYNEIDPFAAQWLRNLIAAKHIAPGDVDERSIRDVRPEDLRGYKQHHFFAGIGVWSHALRLAGWPDDKPVWTGSCPCQPFSAAGKQKGMKDERHLWPEWFRLVRECSPPTIFGEQVAAAVRQGWLDLVFSDLEGEGYACGAVDFPACSVGAPHIRQRVYFVANSEGDRRNGALWNNERKTLREAVGRSATCELADSQHAERREIGEHRQDGRNRADTGRQEAYGEPGTCGEVRAVWSDAIWLPCRDGKARPTQPGLFPLAHGASSRMGRLRAYGNAIVAPQAAELIASFLECK